MNQKPRRLMHRAMPLILGGSLVKQIVIALVLGILLLSLLRAQPDPWAF